MLNKKNTSELEDIVIYLTWSETGNKRTKYINKASATCGIISSGLISGNCNPRTWSGVWGKTKNMFEEIMVKLFSQILFFLNSYTPKNIFKPQAE